MAKKKLPSKVHQKKLVKLFLSTALFSPMAFLLNAHEADTGKCITGLRESKNTFVFGTRKTQFAPIHHKKLRNRENSFYKSSYNFVKEFGNRYARMVFSKIPKNKRVTIAIMMGGAEHLGTLLEAYAHKHGITNVDFRYVQLNTKMMKTWTALNSSMTKSKVGFGKIPSGWRKNGGSEHNLDVISNYLIGQQGLFDNDHIMVVDTGFQGRTVEAFSAVTKAKGLSRHRVEGALLAKSFSVENSVPIYSLNKKDALDEKGASLSLSRWAAAIDHNNSKGAHAAWNPDAFQRSETFQSFQENNGQWHVSVKDELINPQKLENYHTTLLGIVDALE